MHELAALWLYRAQTVALLTVIALLIGEPLARLARLQVIEARVRQALGSVIDKLNRPHRSIATRVYRGLTLLLFWLCTAASIGWLLTLPSLLNEALSTLLLVALMGSGIMPYQLWALWRRATHGTLALETSNTLFADTHALLRHTLNRSLTCVSILVVGTGVWYSIGDLIGVSIYLALAAFVRLVPDSNPENHAFGWAAERCWQLMHALPAILTGGCLLLSSVCVPKLHPAHALAGLRTAPRSLQKFVTDLLDIALEHQAGGWAGTGTAQLTPYHLTRWLAALLVASIIWITALLALSYI